MPRLAIISDIHGNADGLKGTLEHARRVDCSEFVCLGDVADGGPHGEECVRILRENNIPTVQGNHDEDHYHTQPKEEANNWLTSLPKQLHRQDISFCHIAPDDCDEAIRSTARAASIFENFPDFRLLFIGHLHYPAIFESNPKNPFEANLPQWKYNHPFPFKEDRRYIICPGSIGYPRDGIRKLRYAILKEDSSSITICKFTGPLLDFGA